MQHHSPVFSTRYYTGTISHPWSSVHVVLINSLLHGKVHCILEVTSSALIGSIFVRILSNAYFCLQKLANSKFMTINLKKAKCKLVHKERLPNIKN